MDVRPLHPNAQLEAQRLGVRAGSVVVHEVLECVVAIRDALDLPAGQAFRVVQQRVDGGFHRSLAPSLEQGGGALRAGLAGGDLGVQVAAHVVRRPAVGEHERQQVRIALPAGRQPHHRQAQPLREVIMHLHGGAARHAAANVLMVGHGHDIAHQLVSEEHRRSHREVRQMGAAGVGIVDGVNVAGLGHAFGIGGGKASPQFRQNAQVYGNGYGLSRGPALPVEHRGSGVQGFGNDGGVGAFENDELHLRRHAVQLAAQHLQRDRIDAHPSALFTHSQCPSGPRRRCPKIGRPGAQGPR